MARTHPIRDSIRFGYAVGRVRVLETRLLKQSHYERLLDASNFEDQKRILSETVYGAYTEHAQTAEDVEIALDRSLHDLYADFLETANLPAGMVAYFRTMHDYENLRGLLKAEALGIDPAEMLNDLGSVSPAELAAGKLPDALAAALARARMAASAGADRIAIDAIDAVVDTEMYTALAAIYERSSNVHVRAMAETQADLANIKALVRLKAKNAPVSQMEVQSVPGGTITAEELQAAYRLPVEDAVARLVARPTLRGADPEALADPHRFDVAADALIVRRLADARRIAVGPEPVMAFVMRRKLEVSMLRMLLIGKIAGVSRDILRTRMRDVA